MRRIAFAVAVALACCCSSARADTQPLIDGLPRIAGVPETYTPGTPFTFEVRVPRLADFTSYSVELIFSTPETPDPLLTASATAAASHYPFTGTANFQSSSILDADANQVHLLFSDST